MSGNLLSFIVCSRTAWDDYFPGTNPTKFGPQEYTSRQTFSSTYVYVSNCFFNKCTSSSAGGAVYCYNSATYMLVESSSFFNCRSSVNHGAFCFSKSDGQCVLYGVCGNDCCTTVRSNFQFGSITVDNTLSSKNYINYSSIIRCVNEIANSDCTLYHYNGRVCCQSVNMSMNKCGIQSTISCAPVTDSNSVTCSLLYSSFADNIATSCRCIRFNNVDPKYEIKCCNILRNTQVSTSCGLIESYGNSVIRDSCILENVADRIFYVYSSSTATLSNCTIDKTTSTGSLIIQSTVTKSFIFALNHMSTKLCSAEYDSVGTLAPIIQASTCMNIIYYCTCKIPLYQPHLRDFISLICVFMFNFIHPYTSGCL
jgi:hypothetical protein